MLLVWFRFRLLFVCSLLCITPKSIGLTWNVFNSKNLYCSNIWAKITIKANKTPRIEGKNIKWKSSHFAAIHIIHLFIYLVFFLLVIFSMFTQHTQLLKKGTNAFTNRDKASSSSFGGREREREIFQFGVFSCCSFSMPVIVFWCFFLLLTLYCEQ